MKPTIILMRQPNGKSSRIEVRYEADGGVDLIFSHSPEGEVLLMLPGHAVPKLYEALGKHLSPEERLGLTNS